MADIYTIFQSDLHVNEVTKCILWDGDLDRNQQPVTDFLGQRVKFRDMILRDMERDPRAWDVKMACENPRCVSKEHMLVEDKTPEKIEVAFTHEELEQVKDLTHQGFRQDIIAERLKTSRSRIAKIVKVLKESGDLPNGT